MMQQLGFWFVHGLFAAICTAIGCFIGMLSGGVVSLLLATIIGWEVHQAYLQRDLLYFRAEYDYITLAGTFVGGLLFLYFYCKRFIWDEK